MSANAPTRSPEQKEKKIALAESKIFFTKEQANKSLVYVEKIVGDIVGKWKKVLSDNAQRKTMDLGVITDVDSPPSLHDSHHTIQEIQWHNRELREVGCYLRDLTLGIVFFPTREAEKESYLVWRLGQEKVEEFHYPKASSAERPVVDL